MNKRYMTPLRYEELENLAYRLLAMAHAAKNDSPEHRRITHTLALVNERYSAIRLYGFYTPPMLFTLDGTRLL